MFEITSDDIAKLDDEKLRAVVARSLWFNRIKATAIHYSSLPEEIDALQPRFAPEIFKTRSGAPSEFFGSRWCCTTA